MKKLMTLAQRGWYERSNLNINWITLNFRATGQEWPGCTHYHSATRKEKKKLNKKHLACLHFFKPIAVVLSSTKPRMQQLYASIVLLSTVFKMTYSWQKNQAGLPDCVIQILVKACLFQGLVCQFWKLLLLYSNMQIATVVENGA